TSTSVRHLLSYCKQASKSVFGFFKHSSMLLQIIIFLFGLFSQGECDFDTHVYPEHCIYPPGYLNNETDKGLTTPDYVTLRPIERCCPQCEKCKHVGGFCALKWAVHLYKECCDFDPVEHCRDYSCKCCVICGDDKCSPCIETGGNCRKVCRADEQIDWINKCSFYKDDGEGCQCCKRCEATYECTDAYGHCKPNKEYCPHGTYASTGCCGGCTCCKPVQQPVVDSYCEYAGGYCLQGDEHECAAGYYKCFGECSETQTHGGLKSVVLGTCCVPKKTGPVHPIRSIDQFDQVMQGARRHPKQLLE
ncbi:unnamed protein product, partial [Meganyctiphanes norvegica]